MSTATTEISSKTSIWNGGQSPFNASYGKLMMWFFLLSDAFTFSALLVTYGMVRYSHAAYDPSVHGAIVDNVFPFSQGYWPLPDFVFNSFPFAHQLGFDHAPLVFVGIMTFILIMSSVTMVLAVEAGHRMDKKAVEKWMLWTIIGGLTFLGCQAWEWNHFIHAGSSLSYNSYGPPDFAALFFFITGFHGTHVLSGVLLNFLIYYRTVTGMYEKRGHYEMVEKVGLYWHFVDLVWVFVFTFFYLI
ncbi:MAG: cytochrome c oxidase subunit 3 [Cyclobacteriaceae bacterium]|nr:cytochrome c oxidase subunit 3 [Cyclobacteriaceae bacterium]